MDGVLRTDPLLHELESGAEQVTQGPQFWTYHVGSRDQVDPVQLSQCKSIDGIGLHLRVRDGLDEFGMGKGQGHALLVEQVPEPVPGGRGLDRGPGGIRELSEIPSHGEA